MRVIEMHYTVTELAVLLRLSDRWVREKIKAGEFGKQVRDLDGDIRIPASGVNAYLDRNPYIYSSETAERNRLEISRRLSGRVQTAEIKPAAKPD